MGVSGYACKMPTEKSTRGRMNRAKCAVTDEQPKRLTRDSIIEIVQALQDVNAADSCTWNVVEALELLIDAGHFSLAHRLASRVAEMVVGDGRARLFHGYRDLCSLMETGRQQVAIESLERLYIEIHHGGHSLADRIRSALLLARALSVCVSMGTLSEAAVIRARHVLGVELERAASAGNIDLQGQVALELAKSYLHAPTPEPRAAFNVLDVLYREIARESLSPDLAFDLSRLRYQAAKALGGKVAELCSEESLRNESLAVGGVARALAELAVARRDPQFPESSLVKVAELLEHNEFLAGAFEALFTVGSNALDRGHNSSAERYLTHALRIAERGGFLHGKLLVRVGLFQASIIAANLEEASMRCEAIVSSLQSEVALGSMGLNAAAAQQIIGDIAGSRATAERCEKFCKERSLSASQSLAAYTVGSCLARLGDWKGAYGAWSRSVRLDDERCAFMQASERRALLVQGLVMDEMGSRGDIRRTTVAKCEAILARAYETLQSFGDVAEAQRVRGKLHVVHAQMYVMSKDTIGALRHASSARECFGAIGLEYDAALVDALSGLAMIELGKTGAREMFEEAVLTLQRALQFFGGGEYRRIRWKILCYLAVAALLTGEHKVKPSDRMKWRDLAAGWVKGASDECALIESEAADSMTSFGDAEFSPGLKPAALEPLKKALGLGGDGRRKRPARDIGVETGPGEGFVH